ncbi:STAS domain-containing protein [Rhodococcus sp. NPDC058639]|uniref:STAS domain-containing protein n=1 Tax=Rhodococcus sp. NPDC058639 TaxID=3346570 RepID=UPI0036551C68
MTVSQRIASPHRWSAASTWSVCPAPSDVPVEQWFGAEFSALPIGSDVIQIRVRGEIDIRNALALRDFAARHLESSRIVLDLSDVDFFGAVGLRVFEDLETHSRGGGYPWALVGGRPVQRLFRVLGATIPVVAHSSLDNALATLGFDRAS